VIVKLATSLNALSYSTYFGGSGTDQLRSITLDANNNIIAGGETASLDLRLQNALVGQTQFQGGSADGWLFKLNVAATG
jgi:hypothetical protein